MSTSKSLVTITALVGACAGANGPPPVTSPSATATTPIRCDPARDRQSVLAMAGAYDVTFAFTETVALAPGYQLQPPYKVVATELVVVAEDHPEHVVLQHILALGAGARSTALKHWRQDWTYQAPEVLLYRGGERWEKQALAPEQRRCTWVQQVYGIEDAPRYGGWGRWVYQGSTATWTSSETWRPLPRRESKRHDYDVILGVNRHTITPTGWIHEQDNGKLVSADGTLVARERGVIPYQKSAAPLFAVAQASWDRTAPFWKEVRDGWTQLIRERPALAFRPESASPRSLNDDLVALQDAAAADPAARRRQVLEAIARHLEPAPQLARTAAGPIPGH